MHAVLPPLQHACPEPPQAAHLSPVGETMQESPVMHSFWPLQQGWSAPPQAPQVPPPPSTSPVQTEPVWQLPPWQQAAPIAPQLSQTLLFAPGGLLQPSPALQVLLPQHGRPRLPQVPQAVTLPPSSVAVVKHCKVA